ncbi:hypothetical protein [Bradyrhizobium sp. URHD0069]|uniref:hypothetical protein n=1 Tax=Bradyrhizobium sp. URHD0069 TaxID=1380355 RepID=UPI0018CC4659|nr:hypothetical protein [Bradyrhizobium sp. URHD0069]
MLQPVAGAAVAAAVVAVAAVVDQGVPHRASAQASLVPRAAVVILPHRASARYHASPAWEVPRAAVQQVPLASCHASSAWEIPRPAVQQAPVAAV